MSYEDEAFLRDWESTERSRYSHLLEEMKHEYRSRQQAQPPASAAVDLPYTLRLPRAVSR